MYYSAMVSNNISSRSKKNVSYSVKLTKNELKELEKAKKLFLSIKDKYKLTSNDLKELLEEVSFPEAIFSEKLTVLESVVKYLKEEKGFSLKKISGLVGRDQRNIWSVYDSTKKKYSKKFIVKDVKYWVPISIFLDKLSALESVVLYLKEEFSLNYHEIALLLKRDDRTIWTVYQRAKKKNAKTR